MCSVCKDEQCHWGEYCYPSGQSARLRRLRDEEEKAMQRALRTSSRKVGRGKDLRKRNSTPN